MSDSEEEIVVISCMLAEEENKIKKKRRKKWIHNINKKREKYGEYHTLFRDLQEDAVKFFQYFRMSYERFTVLLEILGPHLRKQDTTFRKAIDPKERLTVFLRYV